MEPIDVAKLIGGKVLVNYQGNPAFVNGCTVRLSYALNMCGGSHKIPFSYEKTKSGDADIWDGTNTIPSDHPYYECKNLYFWNLK